MERLALGFVVLCAGLLLLATFATFRNAEQWPPVVVAATFGAMTLWSRTEIQRWLDPKGWKIITLEDQMEAIRDGKVYPLKIRRSMGDLSVSIDVDGKRRVVIPSDFMLQESEEQ